MVEVIVAPERLKKFPRTVRDELPTLSPEAQIKFLEMYNKNAKKLGIAFLLVFVYGLHFVYLDDTSTGIWFWFTIGGLFVWWFIELFKVGGRVKNYNSYLALKTLAEVRTVEAKPHF